MKKTSIISTAVAAIFFAAITLTGCPNNTTPEESQSQSQSTITTVVAETESGGTIDLSVKTGLDSLSGDVTKPVTITGGSKLFDMKGATLSIKSTNVILTNLSNLKVIVDSSVGSGDFTMNSCKVNSLSVNGGGANSVHVNNCTVSTTTVSKESVRIVISAGTELSAVTVTTTSTLEAEDTASTYGTVEVASTVVQMNINAPVKTLTVAEGAKNVTFGSTTVQKEDGTTATVPANVTTLTVASTTAVAITASGVTVEKVTSSDSKTVTVITATSADVSLPENVTSKKFSDYGITSCPKKEFYNINEKPDFTGFKGYAKWSDGTTVELTENDVSFVGFDTSKVVAKKVVLIVYSGITIGSCYITVTADTTKERTVSSYIRSEAEFKTCIEDAMNEYAAYISKNNTDRSASTTTDATQQIEDFLTAAYFQTDGGFYAQLMKFAGLFAAGTVSTDSLSFDKAIDLADISVDTALETATNVYNYLKKSINNSADTISQADFISAMSGSASDKVNKYIDLFKKSDTVLSKFYLAPKFTVDTAASGSSPYTATSLDYQIALTADANKLINNFIGLNDTSVDMAYLPCSTIGISAKEKVALALSADSFKNNHADLMKLISNIGNFTSNEVVTEIDEYGNTHSYTKRKELEALSKKVSELVSGEATIGYSLSALVCTGNGLGGNLSITINDINVTIEDIESIYNLTTQIQNKDSTANSELVSLLNGKVKVTIKSTNTAGATTWSNTYQYTDFLKLCIAICNDLGANIDTTTFDYIMLSSGK